MEKILIYDFLNFIKSKYNIIFFPLVAYIILIEIAYGYITHITFDLFFMNNPITDFLLTVLQPTNLKFLEIFLKFNIAFFVTYFIFYTRIDRPKDLREFLIIKKNLYIYPIIFMYILACFLIYNIIIESMTAARVLPSIINFLIAFLAVEIILYFLLIYPLTNLIDRKWNMSTPKEYAIWAKNEFPISNFVPCLSAGFETFKDFERAKDIDVSYPSVLTYYEKMEKGNFPSIDDYFEAQNYNIADNDTWIALKDKVSKSKNASDFKIKKGIFDINDYALFTLKSKYNIFFLFVVLISIIDYYLQIGAFYSHNNYFTQLTVVNFVDRWIFLYGVIFISYLVYFSFIEKPKRIIDAKYLKINTFLYPIILFLVTNIRIEIITIGPPKPFKDLGTRILEGVMQPFVGAGLSVFIIFIPLFILSIRGISVVKENIYYEYLNGNFVSYSSYLKSKKLGVAVNLDYSYLLMNQDYFKKENKVEKT